MPFSFRASDIASFNVYFHASQRTLVPPSWWFSAVAKQTVNLPAQATLDRIQPFPPTAIRLARRASALLVNRAALRSRRVRADFRTLRCGFQTFMQRAMDEGDKDSGYKAPIISESARPAAASPAGVLPPLMRGKMSTAPAAHRAKPNASPNSHPSLTELAARPKKRA